MMLASWCWLHGVGFMVLASWCWSAFGKGGRQHATGIGFIRQVQKTTGSVLIWKPGSQERKDEAGGQGRLRCFFPAFMASKFKTGHCQTTGEVGVECAEFADLLRAHAGVEADFARITEARAGFRIHARCVHESRHSARRVRCCGVCRRRRRVLRRGGQCDPSAGRRAGAARPSCGYVERTDAKR